ncbi:MAG: formylmethanofuran dehydrogenase subunit E family protein [Deltaproteobacteria bacterium]|nr:formylmethanofuran dehydrogenase subunit E family protein [Deltaproteobacteria bacterium]
MEPFETLLQKSIAEHGHLCAGQVIGVRMAMTGCKLIGIEEPKDEKWRKKIIAYVEIDRCATDAIQSVTGCRMGKRTLKFCDYGINAATFLNLDTKKAYRILSTEESRKIAPRYAPEETDLMRQQLIGYQRMPDDELFNIQQVQVHLEEWEMPGPSRRKAVCMRCGQVVRDRREVKQNNEVLCRICAREAYYIPYMSKAHDSQLLERENVI